MRKLYGIQIPGSINKRLQPSITYWLSCFSTTPFVRPAEHKILVLWLLHKESADSGPRTVTVCEEVTPLCTKSGVTYAPAGHQENSPSHYLRVLRYRGGSEKVPGHRLSSVASLPVLQHGQHSHSKTFHLLSLGSRTLFQSTLCLLPHRYQAFVQMSPFQ